MVFEPHNIFLGIMACPLLLCIIFDNDTFVVIDDHIMWLDIIVSDLVLYILSNGVTIGVIDNIR
jgi:hypothetical protein